MKDDVVTFIRLVDEIAASACWLDREWVLNVADLVCTCGSTWKVNSDRIVCGTTNHLLASSLGPDGSL